MIGQGPTRGLPAILRVQGCNSQNLAAIRPRENDVISSEWLFYFFEFQYGNVRQLGSGNNQKALNKKIIESIEIPLPSLSIQKELVELIESRASILEESERAIGRVATRCKTLEQSVLSRAFSGHLVPSEVGIEALIT
jgi:type I restriction enzyme S subunit